MQAEELVELWNAALNAGAGGKEAALQSALQLLAAPPVPAAASCVKGSIPSATMNVSSFFFSPIPFETLLRCTVQRICRTTCTSFLDVSTMERGGSRLRTSLGKAPNLPQLKLMCQGNMLEMKQVTEFDAHGRR